MIQDPELPGRLLLEQYQVFKEAYWCPKCVYVSLQYTFVVYESFSMEIPLHRCLTIYANLVLEGLYNVSN